MTAPKLISSTATSPTAIDLVFDQAMLVNADLLAAESYFLSPELVAHELLTVKVINTASVRLQLAVNMKSGENYTLAVSSELQSFGGEIMDPNELTALLIGVGDPPKISNAVALSAEAVRVTFSEPMDVAAVSNPERFSIESESSGRQVQIGSVEGVDQGTGLFVQFDLAIASKMTDGGAHSLQVNGTSDAAGNAQGDGESAEFTGIASLPKVLSAELNALSLELRVSFDSAMQEAWINSLTSFGIVAEPDAPQLYYSAVVLSADRKAATLKISEPRDATNYYVIVSPDVLDDYDNAIDTDHDTAAFVGVGVAPVIVRVVAQSQNRIDVVFSKLMRDSAAIRNLGHWAISGGVSVVKVLDVEAETVKLATTDQEPGISYTLTVT